MINECNNLDKPSNLNGTSAYTNSVYTHDVNKLNALLHERSCCLTYLKNLAEIDKLNTLSRMSTVNEGIWVCVDLI